MILPYPSLRQGLVGAWCPSLGASGLTLIDRSGRNNHMTVTSATLQGTQGGVAIETTGTSSVASTSGTAPLLNGVASATISGWIWRSSTTQTVGFGFANSTSGAGPNSGKRFSAIWFNDGNIYVSVEAVSATTTFGAAALSGAGWRHCALVFTGSGSSNAARATLHIDGVPQTMTFTGTIPSTLSSDLGAFCLGKDSSDRFCAGRYDDARAYSRALTPAEIRLLASRRGIGLSPSALLHDDDSDLQSYHIADPPNRVHANVDGVWVPGQVRANSSGTWGNGETKVNQGGVWR